MSVKIARNLYRQVRVEARYRRQTVAEFIAAAVRNELDVSVIRVHNST